MIRATGGTERGRINIHAGRDEDDEEGKNGRSGVRKESKKGIKEEEGKVIE